MKQRLLKRVAIVIGALLAAGTLAGSAAAVLTGDVGGQEIRVDKRQSTDPSSTRSRTFVDLPGANAVVHVPANASRLYDVPFFAESRCVGPQSGWCSVRIIATNLDTGGSVELRPAAGIDYAFDSDMAGNADDLFEGNGMERSIRLRGDHNGTSYRIRVQYAVTNPNTLFRLDDWHLAVHTNL